MHVRSVDFKTMTNICLWYIFSIVILGEITKRLLFKYFSILSHLQTSTIQLQLQLVCTIQMNSSSMYSIYNHRNVLSII